MARAAAEPTFVENGPDFAPEPEPPAAEPDKLDRILALLTDTTARLEQVETDLRETKARTSGFKPMQPPPGAAPRQRGVFGALNAALDGRKGWGEKWDQGLSHQILVDIHGEKIPEMLLSRLRPRFEAGSPVQIDRASVRTGFPEGQTWGDVLDRVGSEGYGTVTRVLWLTDAGQWKYFVSVPGVTQRQPDGFHDDELLPA